MSQANIPVVNSNPIVKVNLTIEAKGGSLVLEGVYFNGLNVTPNGLEIRVSYNANIREIRFTKNIVDDMMPIFEGTVLHEPTGPADVYRPRPVDHYAEKGKMISQTTVNQNQEPDQQNTIYPLQHHPSSSMWYEKGKKEGLMAAFQFGKDKMSKNKNQKDKFGKDKGKKSSPKNKGAGPYDRQSVERKKGPDESSQFSVSEAEKDDLSVKTREEIDTIQETDDENKQNCQRGIKI